MTKIAVYTIALNEEKHVKRWQESAKDADLLLIADTGSTDQTITLARFMGIKVHEIEVKPWRFDIARNASLALIPEEIDLCIQLDMDEVLPHGWRQKVEQAWAQGNTWPIYKHVTSRYADGTPRNYQHYFKIHPRKGFIWKYPIHEVIIAKEGVQFRRELIDLEVDHIQDHSKSRKSYLDLLELGAKESPDDWRMAHYLNREYWYHRDWQKVLHSAYVAMRIQSGWDVERASTCMWASDAALKLDLKELALEWAQRATREAPRFYETWHWHAHINHLAGKWIECFDSASKILTLDRQDHHLVNPSVWEWWGWDLLALSAHKLGDHRRAVVYGSRALAAMPHDKRLKANLGFYRASLNPSASTDSTTQSGLTDEQKANHPVPEYPQGGTEILKKQLIQYCNFQQSDFNLIMSRCDASLLDDSRINILWQHLDSNQDSVRQLSDQNFIDKLDAIVFVSNWQYHSFRTRFSLPSEKCFIIKNAIGPVSYQDKQQSEKIRIIHTPTPWRGLEVLLDAYSLLQRDDCELDIYSSTAVYGKVFYDANERDYLHLYSKAREMQGVNYKGYHPHDLLREELSNADIFAYPSIWTETFCLSAVEAGAAGLRLLLTNLGALPEICGDRATYVPYSDDRFKLAKRYAEQLNVMIDEAKTNEAIGFRAEQQMYFNSTFSWERRKDEWNYLFRTLKRSK